MDSHLLIVDDNRINLKLAGDVLEAAGYGCQRVADAEAALAAVREHMPGLILLDLALPGMDGLSFVQRLRADPAYANIVVVAMTAFAMRGDEQKALAAGCDGYLSKPIDTRRLPEQVAGFLQAKTGRGKARQRVLIADDATTNRKLLRATLEAEGVEVLEASDGLEAIAALKQAGADALISDILMPNLDGYQLCYEIRSDERLCKLPVVVYTNTYTTAKDEQVALDMGADIYLRKPASARVIVDAISRARVRAETRSPQARKAQDEAAMLKSYSGRLIAKLEERNQELESRSEALRASERLLRDLVEHVRDMFWLTDPNRSEFIYMSPVYEKVWGHPCHSLRDEPAAWRAKVHPDDRARFDAAVADIPRTGEYAVEYRVIRDDGELRWLRDRAFPIRDAAGRLLRLAGLTQDISHHKRAEEERARLEAQLHQAQKLKALGSLASGIAHDFNNILTVISSSAELMVSSLSPTHALQEPLTEIIAAGQRAAELVRQILSFGRPDRSGRKRIQLAPVVNDALKLLRVGALSTIAVETDLAPNLPDVIADASQVHQILMNLGTNALQAMRERLGRLSVSLDRAERREGGREHGYVRLTVSDTGCGIEAAAMDHIFEPFFTTKTLQGGSGIGLAVVYGIVQAHGGMIEVFSEPGSGTRFEVFFPAADGGV